MALEDTMRLITKETDYAIRAVMQMARQPGTFVSSAEMAAAEKIPLQFLRRILQRLLKAGLITSREGVAGGASLRERPERIQLLDIMRVFQGRVELSQCMFRRQICANRGTCVLRKRIRSIEKKLADEFAGISIADLLNDAAGNAGRQSARNKARRPAQPDSMGSERHGRAKKRGAR
jgi:Rrf2 family protein